MATGATEFFRKALLAGTAGGAEGTLIGEVWSKYLIITTEKALVLGGTIDHRRDKELSRGGDIIHVPNVSDLAVRSFTSGSATTFETTTTTNTDITVDTIKYAAFAIDEPVQAQSMYDVQKLYLHKLSYAIAKDVDAAVGALFSSFSTNVIGTFNTDVDEDLILLAKQKLDDADVPAEDRVFVVPPRQENALRKINRFTNTEHYGNVADLGDLKGPRKSGVFGRVHGFEVVRSTNLTASGSNVDCAAYHKEAMTLVMGREPDIIEFEDPNYFTRKIGALYVYGTKLMRQSFGVYVKG